MSLFRRIRLLLWTVRYLSFHQVASRILRRGLRWTDHLFKAPTLAAVVPSIQVLNTVHQGLFQVESGRKWKDRCTVAEAAAVCRFRFLGVTKEFTGGLGWHDTGLNQLWRYNLHYFHYTIDLMILAQCSSQERAYAVFRRLVQDWIRNNGSIQGDGWHPYTLSLRAVNWIEGIHFFQGKIDNDDEFRSLILRSLYRQAEILYRDREFDVRGNHLLENLRALIWLGMFFEGRAAEKWFAVCLRVLEVEVAEQVLADGGHFERSPGYHLAVMKNLVEIGLLLRRNSHQVPAWLTDAIGRMSEYLLLITTPDGRVPLLKDTALDAAPDAGDLGAVAAVFLDRPDLKSAQTITELSELWLTREERNRLACWAGAVPMVSVGLASSSEHYVARDIEAGHFLIMDVGKVCPPYLPAHGQADMFTYELFIEGVPVVVDSGIYEYEASPWRDYFRSTRAHNTLEIAGRNQSEVWSNFRVARRARVVEVQTGSFERVEWCAARHDGYRCLKRAGDHLRQIVWLKPDIWIVIDEVVDARGVTYENNLHLYPDLTPKSTVDGIFKVNLTKRNLIICGFGNEESSCKGGVIEGRRQGWYSEKFGCLRKNSVITFSGSAHGGVPFGYMICAGGSVPQISCETTNDGWTIHIVTGGDSVRLQKVRGKLSGERILV